jgi:hypothetical protein
VIAEVFTGIPLLTEVSRRPDFASCDRKPAKGVDD